MKYQLTAFTATGLRAPAKPARLLSLTQKRTDMALAAKTAAGQFADVNLLRRTF
jgi:hypothetical protein